MDPAFAYSTEYHQFFIKLSLKKCAFSLKDRVCLRDKIRQEVRKSHIFQILKSWRHSKINNRIVNNHGAFPSYSIRVAISTLFVSSKLVLE